MKYRLGLYFEHPAVLTNEMCRTRAGTARVNASDRFSGASLPSLCWSRGEPGSALRSAQCRGQVARCGPGHCCSEGTVPSAFSDVSVFPVTFLPLAAQSPGLGHFPKPPKSLCSQPLSHQHPISKGPGSQLTALRKERGSTPTTISLLVAASCVSLLMWSFYQVDHSSTPALPSPGGPCGLWCRAFLRGTPARLRGWR